MVYKVIKNFKDSKDNDRLNEATKIYPREGLKPTEDRLAFIQSKGFIEQVTEEAEKDEKDEEFPMHKGGGNYVLSNGESVKGKEAAVEAENNLKAGE